MFELAFPWALLALPVPLVLWWFGKPATTTQLTTALRVPFFNAMNTIAEEKNAIAYRPSSLWLLLTVWALLTFALAGPTWVGEPLPVEREGYNLMLVIDLSGSMEINDMVLHDRPASRLAVVKRAASQFVNDRKGDKIGLILFGSQAYLQTPLTYDHQSLLMRVQDASVGLAGKTTSIGDAIGLAVKRLRETPAQGRVIILLTDGVNNSGVLSPVKAAELAALQGIKIYTIGLGSDPSAVDPLLMSLNSGTELDENTLKEVAKVTDGQYFRATDSESLQSIYQTINKMETVFEAQQNIRPQHEFYPWPLGAALLLFCLWFVMKWALFRDRRSLGVEDQYVQ
jgi:Ca-activated chloride channel family protein